MLQLCIIAHLWSFPVVQIGIKLALWNGSSSSQGCPVDNWWIHKSDSESFWKIWFWGICHNQIIIRSVWYRKIWWNKCKLVKIFVLEIIVNSLQIVQVLLKWKLIFEGVFGNYYLTNLINEVYLNRKIGMTCGWLIPKIHPLLCFLS